MIRIKPQSHYIAFRTDADMYKELKRLAELNHCTMSVIVRKLLYSIIADMPEDTDNED